MTAADVMDDAAALLNDTAKVLYTYTAQLPYLKIANGNLEVLLVANGAASNRQTSPAIQVLASAVNSFYAGPTNMFVPIRVFERKYAASSDLFVPVDEREWEPNIRATDSLIYWTYRNGYISFPPVTNNREIKIDYWKQLASVTSSSSDEEVLLSRTYLASRTAELCARYVGENSVRADQLRDNEVTEAKDNLVSIFVKNSQGNRSRRRRFRRVYAR